jgi:glycosyltransferase 2 family protein
VKASSPKPLGILKVAFGLGLVWLLWHNGLFDFASMWEAFRRNPAWIALALAAHGMVYVLLGIRWTRLVRQAGFPLSARLGIRLTFVSHFFSSILPGNGAGDLFKAWIASRQILSSPNGILTHRNSDGSVTEIVQSAGAPVRMSLPQTLGTMLPDRLSGMTGLFGGWLLCLLLVFFRDAPLRPLLTPFLIGAGGIFTALLVLLFWLPKLSGILAERTTQTRWAFFLKPLRDVLEALRECGTSKIALLQALGISIVVQGFFYLACFGCSKALGYEIPLQTLGCAMPLVALFNSLPVSPGGLGIGEGVAAAALRGLGYAPQAGAQVMLLLRLVLSVWALTGFVFWLSLRRGARQEVEE